MAGIASFPAFPDDGIWYGAGSTVLTAAEVAMSTIPKPGDRHHAGRNNPFRYGWRDVQRKDERGRMVWDQQPLTLDDVLHPQMGDVILGNEDHLLDVTYLFTVLQAWLASLADVVVLSDVGVYWDIPKLRNHSPDITIIRGVHHDQPYTTFDVAKEGARPEWIIEVTSPGTRRLDLVRKRRHYFLAGVPWYAIVDGRRMHGQREIRLLGYGRGQRAYQPLPLDSQGRLHLASLGLWLGHEQGRAALYDASGQRLRNLAEEAQASASSRGSRSGGRGSCSGAGSRAAPVARPVVTCSSFLGVSRRCHCLPCAARVTYALLVRPTLDSAWCSDGFLSRSRSESATKVRNRPIRSLSATTTPTRWSKASR